MFTCLIPLLAVVAAFGTAAAHDNSQVTPYGDYCKYCTTYGTCKAPVPPKEAVRALEQYYGEKGYALGSVRYKGRFIEAVVVKDSKPVDKVLFDRNTGRIRSVY
ncbi:MAG: hypothetical protein OHK006_20670 [Thermodesulfovibrionales bacterium]